MNKVVRVVKKIITGEAFVIFFPTLSFIILKRRYQTRMKQLATQGRSFILRTEYGGLGDHLVYSALPDILFKKYGIKTEISLSSKFRSEEIKDFVWGKNRSVSFSDDNGAAIALPRFAKYQNYNAVLAGLFSADGHNLFSIGYTPVTRSEFAGKVVCDLTFGPSGVHNGYYEKKFWNEVVEYIQREFHPEDLILLEPFGYAEKGLLRHVQEAFGISSTLPIHSLCELADCICSARDRIFLDSGSKSLAAAYGKPSRVLDRGKGDSYFHYPTNVHVILG